MAGIPAPERAEGIQRTQAGGFHVRRAVRVPCKAKDAAAHDYTLVDALCLASNVGAARWNPNAGKTASEITVASVAEMANAIDAGKSALTLKAGTYDLRELAESGIITLIAPLSLSGKGTVEIIGGFKFGAGTTSFVAENIRFSGAEKRWGMRLKSPRRSR